MLQEVDASESSSTSRAPASAASESSDANVPGTHTPTNGQSAHNTPPGNPTTNAAPPQAFVRIAVVGCTHGEISAIYQTIEHIQRTQLPPHDSAIDLILCCGDFQSVRHAADLQSMAVPDKYKRLGEFQHYYHGNPAFITTMPPTPPLVFIGGNHEASNYLATLYLGGYVSPSMYYMGSSNVLQFAGLTIGGLSGIYKSHDYHRGHDERLPLQNDKDVRSIYHVRKYDVEKLQLYQRAVESGAAPAVDIMLSHDWPAGIEHHGNMQQLLKRKPFFRSDIERGELGSPPAMDLLHRLQPSHWFSAHLHTKFPALVHHTGTNKQTRFLALDKCMPGREWLQILQVPCSPTAPRQLCYSAAWLAISAAALPYLSLTRKQPSIPMDLQWQQYVTHIQQSLRLQMHTASGQSALPVRLPFPGPQAPPPPHATEFALDPQTISLLQILQRPDPFTSAKRGQPLHVESVASRQIATAVNNEEEIDLDAGADVSAADDHAYTQTGNVLNTAAQHAADHSAPVGAQPHPSNDEEIELE